MLPQATVTFSAMFTVDVQPTENATQPCCTTIAAAQSFVIKMCM